MLVKTCNKCSIILNDENKVKNKRLCKCCSRQSCRDYKARNRELISNYNKKYKLENKVLISAYNQYYHQENKDVIQKRHGINLRERKKTDIGFKLSCNYRNRINKLYKKHNPTLSSVKLIDCSVPFLKNWLQSNFKEGMTLENYGSYWHVDHVIPCSLFDMTNEIDVKNCFRWTNLQPLEALVNISKNNRIDENEVIQHYDKVKQYATLHNITLLDFDYKKYF
jgi:hypothetical protein